MNLKGKLKKTNLNIAFQIYKMHQPTCEDDLQVATASYLNALEEHDILAWYFPAPNVYRRALFGLREYGVLPAWLKAKMRQLAVRLGAKGKTMGVKAGVPDCIIFSHQVSIELKYKKNPASDEQKAWMKTASRWGWRCFVVNSAEGVIKALLLCGFTEGQLRGQKDE